MKPADKLRERKHQEFDGEVHLSAEEADEMADIFDTTESAIEFALLSWPSKRSAKMLADTLTLITGAKDNG